MGKISMNLVKTLKLTNVLVLSLILDNNEIDFNVAIEKMQSFIRTKGALQIGPLIQYTNTCINNDNEIKIEIKMMLQCNKFVHNVEFPYKMESVIRVTDCMYCR